MNWITDTIDRAVGAVGDAVSWVSDKVKDVWSSDLGKAALVVAAVYFGGYALTGNATWFLGETAAAGTGVQAAGASELAVATPAAAGTGADAAFMTGGGAGAGGGAGGYQAGVGALEGTQAAAAMEPVAGTAGGIDLTLSGGAAQSGFTVGEGAGALETASAWAADNPMLAYGGMMVGGQAVSGYMQGKQQEAIQQQRLDEERAARDRQNVWGVNYKDGGEGISVADRLKNLNRDYFDSAAPINPAVQDYQTIAERKKAGVLNDVNTIANPVRSDNTMRGAV